MIETLSSNNPVFVVSHLLTVYSAHHFIVYIHIPYDTKSQAYIKLTANKHIHLLLTVIIFLVCLYFAINRLDMWLSWNSAFSRTHCNWTVYLSYIELFNLDRYIPTEGKAACCPFTSLPTSNRCLNRHGSHWLTMYRLYRLDWCHWLTIYRQYQLDWCHWLTMYRLVSAWLVSLINYVSAVSAWLVSLINYVPAVSA